MPIHTTRHGIRVPARLRRAALGLAERAVGAVGDPLLAAKAEPVGLEHLPDVGPIIVACHHAGPSDARLVNAVSPTPLTLVDVPMRLSGEAPWTGRRDRDDLASALEVVARGHSLLVFPEGRRSPDGLVHKGRSGLGALVVAAGIPVVPAVVVLHGSTSQVRFGPPLSFSRHHGLSVNRTLARGVTDEVMTAIADLAAAPYVDSYTSTAHDLLRDQAKDRAQARRVRAAAQREADRAAIQRHRQQVAEETDDLARRVAEAAEDARRHAERASRRDPSDPSLDPGESER